MLIKKAEKIEERFRELEALLADPQVISDQNQYQKLAKEYSDTMPIVVAVRNYRNIVKEQEELTRMLKDKHDKDFEELARSELTDLKEKEKAAVAQLTDLLNPAKAEDNRNVIIEIRAGTGGEEASLFAADLYRMYTRYADIKGWKWEALEISPSETGGFKEVVFGVSGKGAAKYLRWENGAHRVQRVPKTEASGRIHTSAATVAILQEPEEVEVKIEPKDLRIDIFRASGPGGQSVNTADSAIRLTHLPTGIVVSCQDERSQLKNKTKAMRVLRARILDKMREDTFNKAAQIRKLKVGSGDRSEKIRTYNFPDRRITDHRIGFTTHQLMSVLEGELDELMEALVKAEAEDNLKENLA